MKKERQKIIGLFFIFGIVALLILPVIVSAASPLDPIVDMFTDWTEGKLSENIAKYLFWAILALLIYSILVLIPPLDRTDKGMISLRIALALLVSFLSIAYLTPEDLHTILISYGTLGIVLGGIIPFAIILFFSMEVAKRGEVGGVLFSKIIWVAFVAFLIYKSITGMVSEKIGVIEGLIYVAIIVLSIIYMFSQRWIMRILFKEELKDAYTQEKIDLKSSLLGEIERRERDKPRGLTGSALAAYDRKTAKLKDRMEKL